MQHDPFARCISTTRPRLGVNLDCYAELDGPLPFPVVCELSVYKEASPVAV